MSALDESVVREAFQLVRDHSHPDVHDLTRKLEERLLLSEAVVRLHERLRKAELADNSLHSVRADRLPDINGVDPDDPRSDGWYARKADLWDMRDRG